MPGPSTPLAPGTPKRARPLSLTLRAASAVLALLVVVQGAAHLRLTGLRAGPARTWRALAEAAAGGGGGGSGTVLHGGDPSIAGTGSSAPPGGAAALAAEVEAALDASAAVGLCAGGRALLPGVPAAVCRRPTPCLWSHMLGADVDLGLSPEQASLLES